MADQVAQAPAAPVPGSAEYDAAMAAKFDNAQAGTAPEVPSAPPAAARPEHVPEKFWNAETGTVNFEAWSKSTAELEKTLTQGKQAPAAAPAETPPAEPAGEEAAAKAVADAGLNFTDLANEYTEQGAISEESLVKLEKSGIPREMVSAYIAGQEAIAAQRDAKGLEVAGGQEKFNQMASWAKANLSPAELQAFNKGVTGTEAEMIQAVQSLSTKYTAANGSEPALLGGQSAASTQSGYRSTNEMTKAMQDPRYNRDPAYTSDVINKLAATTAF